MSSSIALKTSKTEEKIPDKIWNASFISVFIANMLMFMGQQMMNNINNGNRQTSSTAAGTYKFCPNCGTPVNGAKFCSNCGTKLS